MVDENFFNGVRAEYGERAEQLCRERITMSMSDQERDAMLNRILHEEQPRSTGETTHFNSHRVIGRMVNQEPEPPPPTPEQWAHHVPTGHYDPSKRIRRW